MQERDDVWFATHRMAAEYVRDYWENAKN